MVRPIKPRTHYMEEVDALLRLRRILELDPRPEWRARAVGLIDVLVALLVERPNAASSGPST